MGTDVHIIVERKTENGWLGLHACQTSKNANGDYQWWLVENRNYDLFAEIAPIRGGTVEARGIPDDASELTRYLWEMDGDHTPSWLTMTEANEVFGKYYWDPVTYALQGRPGLEPANGYSSETRQEWACADHFGFYRHEDENGKQEPLDNFRIVFWFDS